MISLRLQCQCIKLKHITIVVLHAKGRKIFGYCLEMSYGCYHRLSHQFEILGAFNCLHFHWKCQGTFIKRTIKHKYQLAKPKQNYSCSKGYRHVGSFPHANSLLGRNNPVFITLHRLTVYPNHHFGGKTKQDTCCLNETQAIRWNGAFQLITWARSLHK